MTERQAELIIGWACIAVCILILIRLYIIFKPLLGIEEPPNPWGACMDCDWEGELKECEKETEPDEFKGTDRVFPVCPQCGGGIE